MHKCTKPFYLPKPNSWGRGGVQLPCNNQENVMRRWPEEQITHIKTILASWTHPWDRLSEKHLSNTSSESGFPQCSILPILSQLLLSLNVLRHLTKVNRSMKRNCFVSLFGCKGFVSTAPIENHWENQWLIFLLRTWHTLQVSTDVSLVFVPAAHKHRI